MQNNATFGQSQNAKKKCKLHFLLPFWVASSGGTLNNRLQTHLWHPMALNSAVGPWPLPLHLGLLHRLRLVCGWFPGFGDSAKAVDEAHIRPLENRATSVQCICYPLQNMGLSLMENVTLENISGFVKMTGIIVDSPVTKFVS